MKITINNLTEQYPKMGVKLPKELNQEEFEFVKDNLDLYNEDDTIKKFIDTFVQKLNEVAAKETTTKPKTEKKKESPATKKVTPKKVKKVTETNTTPVEHFTLEERFIKRYFLLDGKLKTKSQILNFIKSLQRAITDKQIRKTSKYADIIERIQKNLIKSYNSISGDNGSIKINLTNESKEKLEKIVGSKKVRLSVTYIKRFIGLYGKETKDKVSRLLGLINKALDNGKIPKGDPYLNQVKSVQKALNSFMKGGDIDVTETELNGLAGIAECSISGFKKKSDLGSAFNKNEVVSSLDLKNASFQTLKFTGMWQKIIGNPEVPFHLMIYGAGGKGKSTFAVKFATYLSKDLNRKVLYVADEEKISDKLKSKFERFKSYNQNLDVSGKVPSCLKSFDIVFLDSVTSMSIQPEYLESLKNENPSTSFVYILQTNKKGGLYGKEMWKHLGDIVMRFEDGVVDVEKNRFGKVGEYG